MESSSFLPGAFLGFIAGVAAALFVLINWPVGSAPYKQGQIDAINGKIRYELVKQKNGSVVWERIEKKIIH